MNTICIIYLEKKHMKGKSIKETTASGYSDGYLNLLHFKDVTSCVNNNPDSQTGVAFGSCVTLAGSVSTGTTTDSPIISYKSYKMQLQTG